MGSLGCLADRGGRVLTAHNQPEEGEVLEGAARSTAASKRIGQTFFFSYGDLGHPALGSRKVSGKHAQGGDGSYGEIYLDSK